LKALREKLLGEPNKNEPSQKVLEEDELEAYLADGWRYVNSLNNGSRKCILIKTCFSSSIQFYLVNLM